MGPVEGRTAGPDELPVAQRIELWLWSRPGLASDLRDHATEVVRGLLAEFAPAQLPEPEPKTQLKLLRAARE